MIPIDERPILASRAGGYREALPVPALRPHFRCVWTNSLSGSRARRLTVVPDGCVDLLWRKGRFVVVGPDVSAGRPILPPGITVIGLRFQPGAAARWLKLPLTEIVGRELAMVDVWGSEADRVTESLGAVPGVQEQALVLQQLLAKMATTFERPPPQAPAVFELLRAGSGDDDEKRIAALYERLEMSERTSRRWSNQFFGYGLKTLDRILRLQRFQASAAHAKEKQLSALALEAGYADQAHLSREVQALCGMTAAEFVRQLTS